jgi:hypothetical protein
MRKSGPAYQRGVVGWRAGLFSRLLMDSVATCDALFQVGGAEGLQVPC